jgi:hypothetical protein
MLILPKQSMDSKQNPKDIFYRNRKIDPKIYMESQRTPSIWNNIDKEEQNWRSLISEFQNFFAKHQWLESVIPSYAGG